MTLSVSWSRCLTPKGVICREEWAVFRWSGDVAKFQGSVVIEYRRDWWSRTGSISDLRSMALKAAQVQFCEVTP